MVAAARQKNPKLLIALDLFDWKLDIAKKCGADLGINFKYVLFSNLCNFSSSIQSLDF